jgi:hypothetical protein
LFGRFSDEKQQCPINPLGAIASFTSDGRIDHSGVDGVRRDVRRLLMSSKALVQVNRKQSIS